MYQFKEKESDLDNLPSFSAILTSAQLTLCMTSLGIPFHLRDAFTS